MWRIRRMSIFIRHICGERKNTLGHRCSSLTLKILLLDANLLHDKKYFQCSEPFDLKRRDYLKFLSKN